MSKIAIIIPARYSSTRFPGKPLVEICGKTMIERTYEIAKNSISGFDGDVMISTEDERIIDFCLKNGIKFVPTSIECNTGTDRVCETVKKLDYKPELIINLQCDAPLTPPWFLTKIIEEFTNDNSINVITPGYKMSWKELDKMIEDKKITPFTGTTIVMNQKNKEAIWFSKKIIPAIRKEEKFRENNTFSPIIRHIGLYGYSYNMLMKISGLNEGYYEKLEGLEQLRIIENGYKINVIMVDYRGRPSSSGVDNPEDVKLAEDIIKEFGELI